MTMAKGGKGRELDSKTLQKLLSATEDDIEDYLINNADVVKKKLSDGTLSNKAIQQLISVIRKCCEWESIQNLLISTVMFDNKGPVREYMSNVNWEKPTADDVTFLDDIQVIVTVLAVSCDIPSVSLKLKQLIALIDKNSRTTSSSFKETAQLLLNKSTEKTAVPKSLKEASPAKDDKSRKTSNSYNFEQGWGAIFEKKVEPDKIKGGFWKSAEEIEESSPAREIITGSLAAGIKNTSKECDGWPSIMECSKPRKGTEEGKEISPRTTSTLDASLIKAYTKDWPSMGETDVKPVESRSTVIRQKGTAAKRDKVKTETRRKTKFVPMENIQSRDNSFSPQRTSLSERLDEKQQIPSVWSQMFGKNSEKPTEPKKCVSETAKKDKNLSLGMKTNSSLGTKVQSPKMIVESKAKPYEIKEKSPVRHIEEYISLPDHEDVFIHSATKLLKNPGSNLLEFLKHKLSQMKYKLNGNCTQRETRLMIELFSKAMGKDATGNPIPVMTTITDTDWLTLKLSKYLRDLHWLNLEKEEVESLKHMTQFCRSMLLRIPHLTAFPISVLLADLVKRFESSQFFNSDTEFLEEIKRTAELAERMVTTHIEENISHGDRDENSKQTGPVDNFLEVETYPVKKDFEGKPYLPVNKAKGKYTDPHLYLDTQFRLLREDFMDPLRKGIQEYCETVKSNRPCRRLDDAFIYTNVTFVGIKDGFMVTFDGKNLRHINWNRTKRLLTGSLVCLSNSNFETFVTGTVYKHDVELLKEAKVEIMIDAEYVESLSFVSTYTMIEATSFYEAYKHVLKRLKELGQKVADGSPIPFQIYIVDVNKKPMLPSYMNQSQDLKLKVGSFLKSSSLTLNELLNGQWAEENNKGTLDESQLRALHTVFSQELAIIQGPPGTGKTYIGLKIMEFLYDNRTLWKSSAKDSIMIICYTNHALDQFLEEILNMRKHRKLVRIGGRCSEESPVYEHTLRSIRERRRPRKKGDSESDDDEVIVLDLYEEPQRLKHKRDEKRGYDRLLRRMKGQLLDGPFGQYLIHQLSRIVPWKHQASLFIYRAPFGQCLAYWLLGLHPYEAALDNDELETLEKLVENKCQSKPREAATEEETKTDESKSDQESITNVKEEADLELEHRDAENENSGWTKVTKKKKGKEDIGDDWARTKKLRKQLYDNLTEKAKMHMPMKKERMVKIMNVWKLDLKERFSLYLRWLQDYMNHLSKAFQVQVQRRNKCNDELNEMLEERDLDIILEAEVIGMTTTGASKYSSLIQKALPRIVIVEEAAEVLEAHIITSLTEKCQHLILIGDHKQLRPNPTVYNLARKHNLDISFFERMLKNEFPVCTLLKQHRMRPEISSLLVPLIYKKLQDDDSVKNYPDVLGLAKNVVFLDHSHPEDPENESRSHSNDYEAEMIVNLAKYLLQQGYYGEDITILTPYTGQMYTIRDYVRVVKKESNMEELLNIRITPVDNYQGEENKIILISFVRSNKQGNVGFVKVSNRVCVALSRAKWGMYCIGNFTSYAKISPLWEDLVGTLKKRQMLMKGFLLACQQHPSNGIFVKSGQDFLFSPDGGCHEPCTFVYPGCGHNCVKFCHSDDKPHIRNQCKKPCEKICPNGHPCPDFCGSPCDDCVAPCSQELECGHLCILPCGQEARDFGYSIQNAKLNPCLHPCMTNEMKILPCGHEGFVRCSTDVTEVECDENVQVELECGHNKQIPCEKRNKIHELICEVILPDKHELPCGHKIDIRCHQLTSEVDLNTLICKEPCKAKLPCGHLCLGKCSDCFGQTHATCNETCRRKLICGHHCKKKCGEICGQCRSQCQVHCWHLRCNKGCMEDLCTPCTEKCSWECKHKKCKEDCEDVCDRGICDKSCDRLLPCGHECLGLCGEPCPLVCHKCNMNALSGQRGRSSNEKKYIRLSPCMHAVDVEEMDKMMEPKIHKGLKEVEIKKCPFTKCKKPIVFCPRYKTEIKKSMKLLKLVARKRAAFAYDVEVKRTELNARQHRSNERMKTQNKVLQQIIDAIIQQNYEEAEELMSESSVLSEESIRKFKDGYQTNKWLECNKGHLFKSNSDEDIVCSQCKTTQTSVKSTKSSKQTNKKELENTIKPGSESDDSLIELESDPEVEDNEHTEELTVLQTDDEAESDDSD